MAKLSVALLALVVVLLLAGCVEPDHMTFQGSVPGVTDVYSTKTFSPFTHAAAAGPDGTIWFTEGDIGIHSTTVHKLNVDGSEVDVKLPGGGYSNGVTLGPDGSMWITQATDLSGTYDEFSTCRLVRIFRSGEIKVYDIPTRNGVPFGVAVDPKGNVWFTGSKAAKIGYRSTSGAFREYTLADKASSPTALAIGSDGSGSSSPRRGESVSWIADIGFTFFRRLRETTMELFR